MTSQWANFVRNHDELTLDKLSDDERQEVFDAFGPDPDMQLYGRGLRRRLPSMLGGDERRMRMVYSLMFSLPGTPVLFYGEEIGMAENLDIPGRLAVRTPMQWTAGANGGFSKARSGGSPAPSPTASTARSASTPPTSATTTSPSGGSCATSSTPTGSSRRSAGRRSRSSSSPTAAVLAHVCREESGWAMVALHNFGADSCIVPIELEDVPPGSILVDLLDGLSEHELDAKGRIELGLEAYGYRWLRLLRPRGPPDHLSRPVNTSSRGPATGPQR